MLLFFSVARSAPIGQADRASEAHTESPNSGAVAKLQGIAMTAEQLDESGEKMPTDKLLDVSPMALRMSSPFNAGYWLNAA